MLGYQVPQAVKEELQFLAMVIEYDLEHGTLWGRETNG